MESEKENKQIATEVNFKIRRLADLFASANQMREEGENIAWSDKLAGILIEIRPKLTTEKLTECDNKLRTIRRKLSGNMQMAEMQSKGYRIATAGDLGMSLPATTSIYDMLIELTYQLQALTEEIGFGEPNPNKKQRGEY